MKCDMCGSISSRPTPAEICPVSFTSSEESVEMVDKEWLCTICGYIHIVQKPQEVCPVCKVPPEKFIELGTDGREVDSFAVEEVALEPSERKASKSLLNTIVCLLVRHHLHPILSHFPNGILPVVVTLLVISIGFNLASLESAAFYNLIAVLLTLPFVLLTGYLEWQKSYKGMKTPIFKIKIICSLIVLVSTSVLVFWRIVDPEVVAKDSAYRLIYLGIAVLLLGAAGVAGHLGGKLVFPSKDNSS